MIMLISPSEVKAASYLGDNFDEQMLGQAIREAQEIHLQGIIGTALLDKLKALVEATLDKSASGITAAENAVYKTLLDDYITPYLAEKVQSVAVLPTTLKMRNMGLIKNADENAYQQTTEDIYRVQRRFNTKADRYATQISMYLCKHRAEMPELDTVCGCDYFVKPLIGKTFVNVPINLAMEGSNCCC